MSAIDTDLATTLRERRGAVDAAMSRDRGRLLGLWSRWQGKPGNPQLRQAFEQALGVAVNDEFEIYERLQAESLASLRIA